MKILVTGGAGFIGGHLALHLKRKGFNVIAVDNLERSSEVMIKLIRDAEIPLLVEDLRDSSELPVADVIIHAAAYIDVAESFKKPYEYMVNNVAVTGRMAKKAFDEKSYLIYISSAAVYGNPVYLPIDEVHPRNPLSPYGLSKLLGEQVVEFYSKLGLRSSIVRLFNVYGPCQSEAYAGVITKFINRVKRGELPIIFGTGGQTRDFIHVRDVAEFIEVLIMRNERDVFNVGTGKATSINELADLIIKLAGVNMEPIYAPHRRGDIEHSVANVSKALSLGWKPRICLEEGLRELLRVTNC
ncbi:MAG: GDP-mannose 4,6-dehydratase [Desulfurococcaceae archaeon]